MTKPDCYQCIFRQDLPGNAHSKCGHPDNKDTLENPLLNMMAIFASVERVGPVLGANKLDIKGDAHGIRNGWFNWPFNFDPVWLLKCNGFKKK